MRRYLRVRGPRSQQFNNIIDAQSNSQYAHDNDRSDGLLVTINMLKRIEDGAAGVCLVIEKSF